MKKKITLTESQLKKLIKEKQQLNEEYSINILRREVSNIIDFLRDKFPGEFREIDYY